MCLSLFPGRHPRCSYCTCPGLSFCWSKYDFAMSSLSLELIHVMCTVMQSRMLQQQLVSANGSPHSHSVLMCSPHVVATLGTARDCTMCSSQHAVLSGYASIIQALSKRNDIQCFGRWSCLNSCKTIPRKTHPLQTHPCGAWMGCLPATQTRSSF